MEYKKDYMSEMFQTFKNPAENIEELEEVA